MRTPPVTNSVGPCIICRLARRVTNGLCCHCTNRLVRITGDTDDPVNVAITAVLNARLPRHRRQQLARWY